MLHLGICCGYEWNSAKNNFNQEPLTKMLWRFAGEYHQLNFHLHPLSYNNTGMQTKATNALSTKALVCNLWDLLKYGEQRMHLN